MEDRLFKAVRFLIKIWPGRPPRFKIQACLKKSRTWKIRGLNVREELMSQENTALKESERDIQEVEVEVD